MKSILNLFFVFALALAPQLMAHEHGGLGKITGENVDLFYSDHAISGHIKGKLLFATPLEKEFGIALSHWEQGKKFDTVFKKNGTALSGEIESLTEKGEKTNTKFAVSKISAKEGVIEGQLNGQAFKVKVSSDKMEEEHYINPLFQVNYLGKDYSFKLQDGMACIGCSLKISFVVLGMLSTAGAL